MEWKSAEHQQNGAVIIPKRWLQLHYYEALNILFRTENALRVFVYITLKNSAFDKWAETELQVSDSEKSSIKALAKKRISQAEGFGYLGYSITSPLMHLNSGELVRLITSDSHWANSFKPYFKGKREVIRTKLDEVGTVRNSLAHFRPIKNDDIELIKQNVKHALIGVEECLSEMMNTYNVVPTNTKDDWYSDIKIVGTELCEIQVFESKNEEWLRLQVLFKSKTLKREKWWAEYISFTVLNLVSPAIAKFYSTIRKYVTYISESIPHTSIGEELNPSFSKAVSLTFRKDVFVKHHTEISEELKKILLDIDQEVDLVQQDNLAKGRLIQIARTAAQMQTTGDKKHWTLSVEGLKNSFKEDDPAEYWSDVGLYQEDFVAGTSKYPWMPSDISYSKAPWD